MAGQTLKPPFAYYGGKAILAPQIARLLPEHDHYVEPFAGSLAVLLAKNPSRAETINDLDHNLITFWRVLRDRPEELLTACQLTPYSRAELTAAEELDVPDDLERARRVWVRITQGRTGSLRPSPGWKRNFNTTVWRPATERLRALGIPDIAERLSKAQIECRDAIDVIKDYGSEPSVCIYADPPYLGSTRAGNYGVEMMEASLHVRFAEACNNAKSSVVVSGFASQLYDELFEGWHRIEMKAPTNLNGDKGQNEVLWSNVPLGAQTAFDLEGIA